MKFRGKIKTYAPAEERLNILSHAFGFLLSLVGLLFLITHPSLNGNARNVIIVGVFGVSLCFLFASSTLYHSSKNPTIRIRLRILDHISIYILIAGTYTPFSLITLKGSVGWTIFGLTWGLAITGIIIKLYNTGTHKTASTLMYIFMGWVIIFAIKPLITVFPVPGLCWLFGGGLAYTIGAVLYGIKRLKFNHAIFHLLVLIGAFCHFISIYFFILPAAK